MVQKYGSENIKNHMADTRDTLCYATNENQDATYGLLKSKADLALVVGGYNSSNTSHLVELCEEKLPTYYVANEQELLSSTKINHFDYKEKTTQITTGYLPKKQVVDIILTSGASCPDTVVENVLNKILSYFPEAKNVEEVLAQLEEI